MDGLMDSRLYHEIGIMEQEVYGQMVTREMCFPLQLVDERQWNRTC